MARRRRGLITKAEARAIAAARIGEHQETPDGVTPVIVDAETIEREFGWVFFYQSQEYLLTNSVSDMLLGNAPIVVDRDDGTVSTLKTYGSIAEQIEEYSAEHRRRGVRARPPRPA